MQLVITPKDGTEKFLIEVSPDANVASVKDAILVLKGYPVEEQRLLHDDLDLNDSSSLTEAGLQAFSDITLVTAPKGSPSLDPRVSEGNMQTTGPEQSEVVSKDELQRTVVVTGIPSSSESSDRATQDSLQAYFSEGGNQISRIILQSEEGGEQQHAVIIFASVKSVPKAVQLGANKPLLGAMVNVVAAMQLSPDEQAAAESKEALDRGEINVEMGPKLQAAQDSIASMLASGFASGKQGVASVRSLDDRFHVGDRVKAAHIAARDRLGRIDGQYGITEKANSALQAARAKTGELDERFKLSEGIGKAVDDTKQKLSAFDERHQISATASAKVKEIDERFNVTGKAKYAQAAVSSFFGGIASKFNEATKDADARGVGEVHDVPPPQPGQ